MAFILTWDKFVVSNSTTLFTTNVISNCIEYQPKQISVRLLSTTNMVSLFFRNLLFINLQPGMVAGLIPFWIFNNKANIIFESPLKPYHFAGTVIFIIGLTILLQCITIFAVKGRGTLSPADPTKKLVLAGLYKFSRNPMYIGVILVLIGEAIFFRSSSLWIYSFGIFIVFNSFIFLFEEPRLRRDFKEEYDEYCKKVRRWI